MFGNLGAGELMIILVIVLVLFGAKRVPEISASFGKGIREFKRNLNEVESTVINGMTEPVRSATPWTSVPRDDQASAPAIEATSREPKRLL